MLLRQKAYSIAEGRLRAAYEGRKKQLGMENADTIQAFTKLADVYLELQDWAKSLALLIEEHERLKKKFKKIQEEEGWCTVDRRAKYTGTPSSLSHCYSTPKLYQALPSSHLPASNAKRDSGKSQIGKERSCSL